MNTAIRPLSRAFERGFLLVLCLAAQTVTADINVDMTTTPLGGGIFQYDFSVGNSGPDDVVLVTITDAPLGDPLIGLTLITPVDFLGLYDPGLGFVDFLEFTGLFGAGTTTSGFQFQSQATPPTYLTSFQALTVNGDSLSGRINRGVPDTGSTMLMAGLGFMALTFLRKKL